jgi:hypothetical protein
VLYFQMAGGFHGGEETRPCDERDGARQRRPWGAGTVAGGAAGLLVALALVAAASHRALRATSAELALRERSGAAAMAVGTEDRADSERVLTSLWDEDAVGKALDAEINAVKKSFMRQQESDKSRYFKVKLHQTGLQATNASVAGNFTNVTVNGTEPLFAFDGQWFADW